MKFAGARGITRSRVPLIAMLALAATIGLAGCEGDDGKDGAQGPTGPAGADSVVPGPTGPTGPAGPVAGIEKPLEACAVCHGDNSLAEVDEAHALDREVSFTVVTPPAAVGNDLVVTINIKVNGANYDLFTDLQRSVVFNGVGGVYTQYDLRGADSIDSVSGGNYTIRMKPTAVYEAPAGSPVINPASFIGKDSRFYFRLQSVGDPTVRRASVYADDAAYVRPALVSNRACQNGHSTYAGDENDHHYNPFNADACVACHSAVNPPDDFGLAYLVHGIHNSHNMPGGEFVLEEDDPATPDDEKEAFEKTYPTYMTNCSVCHDSAATQAAANSMPPSYEGCLTCHGSMEGFGFEAGNFHLNADATVVCTDCHKAPLLPATVADFHNGLETERLGIIWDGEDKSVSEGKKFTWKIDNIVDDGTNLKISWSATFDKDGPGGPLAAAPINPCNTTATADAPVAYPYGPNTNDEGRLSMLRSYVQGDDYVLGKASGPGQANATNLEKTNTVCAGNVATTTIPVEAGVPAGTRGVVALQGKWQIPVPDGFEDSLHAAGWPYTTMFVRVPTPVEEWIVGSSGLVPKADQRRLIADTTQCLKCHVGSLYQHGNTRVDNVTMCVICHNSASSDQNNRVTMGVDKTEAYDGRVGQTYEFKTMLHRLHTVGLEEPTIKNTIAIYRTRGIFAWAPEGETPPNWTAGTACQVVSPKSPATTPPAYVDLAPFEAIPPDMVLTRIGNIVNGASKNADGTTYPTVACQTHSLYHPTYPRAANDCAACHKDGFDTIVDQTKGVATTLDAGVASGTPATWANQLDDVLQGANTAACTGCHQDAATAGHAEQNGWIPTTFPNGRQTIIDAAK